MGKKQVKQLLDRLKANQQEELTNAAAIFTVAQVAVNQLQEQIPQDIKPIIKALPPAPILITQSELLQRYGSYNNCRKAAKERGIKFSRTPNWSQLAIAFSYFDNFQQMIKSYLEVYPTPELQSVTFELKIE